MTTTQYMHVDAAITIHIETADDGTVELGITDALAQFRRSPSRLARIELGITSRFARQSPPALSSVKLTKQQAEMLGDVLQGRGLLLSHQLCQAVLDG